MGVLCCISPARVHVDETRSSLKFAASAAQVVMKPVVNEAVDQQLILLKLQKELAETRTALLGLQSFVKVPKNTPKDTASIFSSPTAVIYPVEHTPKAATYFDSESLSPTSAVEVVPDCCRPNEAESHMDASSEASVCAAVEEDSDDEIPEPLPESHVRHHCEEQSGGGAPIEEVIVMMKNAYNDDASTVARLADSEERVKLLEEKVAATDGLVETLFKDLEHFRLSNDEYSAINSELERKLQETQREGAVLPQAELDRNKIALVKYTFYTAIAMYFAGQTDLQLASVLFMWLTMEGNALTKRIPSRSRKC